MIFFKESSDLAIFLLELLALVSLLSILKFYYDYATRPIPYPGPLPLPIIGNLHQYLYHRNDIPSWLHQLSLKHGGIFELYFGSDKHLLISDPRVVERVMSPVKDGNYFMRVKARKLLEELKKGDNGVLFNTNQNSWSHVRKIIVKSIASPNALKISVDLTNNVLKDLEKLWDSLIEEEEKQEKSVEIDFVPWAKGIFAETIMYLTASRKPEFLSTQYNKTTTKRFDNVPKSLNEKLLEHLIIASDCVQYHIMVPPLIRNLPFVNTYTNYLYNSVVWTRNYGYDIVKERKKEIESINKDDKEKLTQDMLSMLLTTNTQKDANINTAQTISDNDNKKILTDEEVAETFMEMLSEGIDSPTNALSFIVSCVGNSPDVEKRILEEIEKVFGHESDFNITYEDLNKLEYIDAVIKEVLRLRPVTATISRFSVNSDQIDEYKIPPSTQLAVNVMGLQKNPNHWKEPEKFDPSRFLARNDENETYNKNAFMNFGGGLRICPGRYLAMVQLKMVVAVLYSKYKIEVITKDPSTRFNVNVQCKELNIRIKHRNKI